MGNAYFRFKQFVVHQQRAAMKVTTDACLFGAVCARRLAKLQAQHNGRALDIGTGTGLLSLMVAQQTALRIDAIEIEENAATEAGENIAASPYRDRIRVIRQDILDFKTDHPYSFIFSNPPFYENEWKSSEHTKNIAHHGHSLKLDELLEVVERLLSSDGSFFLLLPTKRQREVEELFKNRQWFVQEEWLLRQTVRHAPFRVIYLLARQPSTRTTGELSIKDAHDQYTAEFIDLLKDYYLYL
jgi:tRNA1Val (adenine37-N6)-methyltransferase